MGWGREGRVGYGFFVYGSEGKGREGRVGRVGREGRLQ